MSAGLPPLSWSDFIMGLLRTTQCRQMWPIFEELDVSIRRDCSTPTYSTLVDHEPGTGSNGIRANPCCLRRLKSVSHQRRLFMLASRRKLYQMESFVFVLLSSRHATTRLLPRHSCTKLQ